MKFSAKLHGTEITMQHVKVGKRGDHIAWNISNGPGGVAPSYSVALKQANDALLTAAHAKIDKMVS